jgi:hypothetical protein
MRLASPCCSIWPVVCLFVAGCDKTAFESPGSSDRLSVDSATLDTTKADFDEDALRERLDRVIDVNRDRHMDPKTNSAWQIVHGILAYGQDLLINDDGNLVPALDWLLSGHELKGWELVPGEKGLKDVVDPGSKTGEGHDDQWLGYLAQCGMPVDTTIKVRGRDEPYTIADLLSQSQWDVKTGMEATWTLMGLSTYLPVDAKWTSSNGTQWSIEKLVEMETAEELETSACGGTHRMYGIAVALNRYLDEGHELAGAWKSADDKVQEAIRAAKTCQQPDGGFSTEFFKRAASSPDLALRLNTTGHTFEFLSVALSDQQLREPWMTRALEYLLDAFEATEGDDLECGGLYHAAHGLILYRERRFAE